MHTIYNLTNSPYPIPTARGSVVIPARGEVTEEVDNAYIELLKKSPAFRIEDAAPAQPKVKRGRKPNGRTVSDEQDDESDRPVEHGF